MQDDLSIPTLKRHIAEALGYAPSERRPRESVKRFCEILAPDGKPVGSAAGMADEEQEIVELAWQDAINRLPDWTSDLNLALALAEPDSPIKLVTWLDGTAYAEYRGHGGVGASLAEAFCRAWLAWHE